MSRRLIVLLLVSVLALSCVFASKNTVNVQLSPYAYQKVKFKSGTEFKTMYCFGAKAGYRYALTDSISIGAFVSYENFKFNSIDDRYHVLSLMPELGTTVKLSDMLDLDFAFALGADYRIFKNEKHLYPAGSGYIGLSVNVSELVSVTAGSELKICYQSNSNGSLSSTDTNLIFSLGSKINL